MQYMARISIRNKDGQEQIFKKHLSIFFPKAQIISGICTLEITVLQRLLFLLFKCLHSLMTILWTDISLHTVAKGILALQIFRRF